MGVNNSDDQLRETWSSFCEALKQSGELVFRDTAPAADIDRVKGLRLLSRNIALGLQFHLENNDPDYPELLPYFNPLRKQGGDNTDALYVGGPVNGQHSYRITGNRGDARFFAITVLENGATPWGGAVVAQLLGSDIEVDADGSFEVVLSPDPQPGNWIRTTDATWRVTVRQFFADWEGEAPMRAAIERLDQAPPKPEPTIDTLSNGLLDSARWVSESTRYWADMLDKWQALPNAFKSYRQLEDNAIDATPGGEPLICYWKVPHDSALIIRVHPPSADYWSVEFGNYWWESMDYRYRLCSTNCYHAQLEDDGELIVVASHVDPGLPNWLDTCGHNEGYVTYRWVGAQDCPIPQCELVGLAELDRRLPASCQRINVAQRAEQLAERRRGVNKRFY